MRRLLTCTQVDLIEGYKQKLAILSNDALDSKAYITDQELILEFKVSILGKGFIEALRNCKLFNVVEPGRPGSRDIDVTSCKCLTYTNYTRHVDIAFMVFKIKSDKICLFEEDVG